MLNTRRLCAAYASLVRIFQNRQVTSGARLPPGDPRPPRNRVPYLPYNLLDTDTEPNARPDLSRIRPRHSNSGNPRDLNARHSDQVLDCLPGGFAKLLKTRTIANGVFSILLNAPKCAREKRENVSIRHNSEN
jgi:hypothetical protein